MKCSLRIAKARGSARHPSRSRLLAWGQQWDITAEELELHWSEPIQLNMQMFLDEVKELQVERFGRLPIGFGLEKCQLPCGCILTCECNTSKIAKGVRDFVRFIQDGEQDGNIIELDGDFYVFANIGVRYFQIKDE